MVKVRARLGKSVYQDHLNVARTGGGWELLAKLYPRIAE